MGDGVLSKEYSLKELKRAHRDFVNISNDLINSNSANVDSNIHSFFELIEGNSVIYDLIEPLLQAELDWKNIEESHLRLIQIPNSQIHRNAYFIQVLKKVKNKERNIHGIAISLGTRERNINRLITHFMNTLAVSSLRDIGTSLGDLIDDVVGEETVAQEKISVIYNEIHAKSGTAIAIGRDITQTINYYDINVIQEIKSKLDEADGLSEDVKEELKDIADQLKKINESTEVNQSNKKELAERIRSVGGQIGLGVFTNCISDPEFLRSVISLFI